MNSTVFALANDGAGNLYAGGYFVLAGGVAAKHVAKWDGSSWSALGTGMGGDYPLQPLVKALVLDGAGNLYAGGEFTTAGGLSANYIAMWDGSSWSPLGTGLNGSCRALVLDGAGNLYAAGGFFTAGGEEARNVARWDGSSWSPLGTGMNSAVNALALDNAGNLYAGGHFTMAGGVAANYVAKWDGSSWSPLGTGMNNVIHALALDGAGNLYAGGQFTTAGGVAANYIAKWDGSFWSPLGSGMDSLVKALACDSAGRLYAAGYFTTAGGVAADYIAKWDGSSWSSLGSGMNERVFALVYGGTSNLYAGGLFGMVGGVAVNYIARWGGPPPSPTPTPEGYKTPRPTPTPTPSVTPTPSPSLTPTTPTPSPTPTTPTPSPTPTPTPEGYKTPTPSPTPAFIYVPDHYGTIQAAVDAASPGGTVIVRNGTWTGDGNKNITFRGKAITLRSENGPKTTIIDCMWIGRGFNFQSGETSSSIVSGFTVTNGHSNPGGGIYIYNSSPSIANCIITRNSVYDSYQAIGGGIYILGGSPVISHSVISENNATGSDTYDRLGRAGSSLGGGIFSDSRSAVITHCSIYMNTANGGNAYPPFPRRAYAGDGFGGGVWGSPTIINCEIHHNLARGGEAMGMGYPYSGNGYGGAVYGAPVIINSTIADNTASGPGGADNGGISGGNTTNSILWGNSPGQAAGTVTFSDVQGGYPGTGNIAQDPQFAAGTKNYRLTKNSPCIDVGDDRVATWAYDLDGNPRIIKSRYSLIVDMGAYEFPGGVFLLDEGFNGFHCGARPADWIFINCNDNSDTYTVAGEYGRGTPSIRLDADGDTIITPSFALSQPEDLIFWIKGLGTGTSSGLFVDSSGLFVEEFCGAAWSSLTLLAAIPSKGTVMGPFMLDAGSTRLRFSYQKVQGDIAFDDVRISAPFPIVPPTPTPCVPAPGFPEGFDEFIPLFWNVPDGWLFAGIEPGDIYTAPGFYGESSPSLKFDDPGDWVVSCPFSNPAGLYFWLRGAEAEISSFLLVEELYDTAWHYVAEVHAPDIYGGIVVGPLPLYPDTTRIRFTYSAGTVAFDDVNVCRLPGPTLPPPTSPTPSPWPTGTMPTPPPSPTPLCLPCMVEVSGRIFDSMSLQPLVGVFVQLDWKDWGVGEQSEATFSDQSGFYYAAVPSCGTGEGVVAVFKEGYRMDSYYFTDCTGCEHDFHLDPLFGNIWWYLPAGGTRVEDTDFDTFILVFNPEDTTAQIEIRFVGTDQVFPPLYRTVPPGTRYTVNMRDHVGPGRENVAAIVRSVNNVPIIVERAMYFPAEGGQAGGEGSGAWVGSHCTIGLSTTGKDWFLAEGATHIFDEFVHILNPNTAPTEVAVTFFNQDGVSWSVQTTLEGPRIWTVKANDVADNQNQLSTRVESSQPVAVDRTMYWPKGDSTKWQDGHATIGVLDFSEKWYFAEGATHIFDEYVLVANPSETQAANVIFTFSDQYGNIAIHTKLVEPRSRYTVKVNNIAGWESKDQVSTRVSSDVPVVAERAMYWPKGSASGWTSGHGTVGVSTPQKRWQFAEGATHVFDEYVLVANPNLTQPANVFFTFRDQSANTWTHNATVQPQRRYTVKVNNVVGAVTQISTTVEADIPVVAERAMYLPPGSSAGWKTGHVTVGYGESVP